MRLELRPQCNQQLSTKLKELKASKMLCAQKLPIFSLLRGGGVSTQKRDSIYLYISRPTATTHLRRTFFSNFCEILKCHVLKPTHWERLGWGITQARVRGVHSGQDKWGSLRLGQCGVHSGQLGLKQNLTKHNFTQHLQMSLGVCRGTTKNFQLSHTHTVLQGLITPTCYIVLKLLTMSKALATIILKTIGLLTLSQILLKHQ